jgi:pilus assembly protein CpaB
MVFGLVLIVGVGLAGFAVHMVKGYMGNYEAELERERAARAAVKVVETATVYVVNEGLRYGQRITAEDVRPVQFPVDAIPEGSFSELATLFPESGPNFRTAMRSVEKDEALLISKVTEPGKEAGITSRLQPGMRAFAITVDVSSGVSGFLRPGDNVDIFWTGNALGQEITKLIDTRVNLIAIDQSTDEDATHAAIARTVTVQVTPAQVAALAQAQSSGRLSLALVGVADDSVAEAVEIDKNRLLGIEEQQVVEVEQKEVCTTKTRRGTETIIVEIPC